MVVDEVWSYTPGRAILSALRLLCPPCNAVTHAGQSISRGVAEKTLVDHCAQVNSISQIDAVKLFEEAFNNWHKLQSSPFWQVTVSSSLLEQFPALGVLDCITV